ncbi:MAG: GGDEF domain-containing protein [Candidatus Adiutrix sp.]
MFFFSSTMIGLSIFTYRAAGEAAKIQVSNKGLVLAKTVAVFIENDVENFKKFVKTLNQSDAYYVSVKNVLEEIKSDSHDDIAFLYIERQVSDTQTMSLFDADKEGAPTFLPPGALGQLSEVKAKVYGSKSGLASDFVQYGNVGSLLSAYAPITDPKSGELLGLVGVDITTSSYNEALAFLRHFIFIGLFVLISVAVFFFWFVSGHMEKWLIFDSLTGIYNRRYLDHELKRQVKVAKGSGAPLSVLMMDLDHFKKINDAFGHAFGDHVLISVVRAISPLLRTTDCFGRYGGEEFCVCLPKIDLKQALSIGWRIRNVVEETRIYNPKTDEYVKITISIGVAQYVKGETVLDFLNDADNALYEAKKIRNAVSVG